jgi:ADP-heptose:LPS heptosyltransferase
VETPQIFAGSLTFPQIAALAREAVGYVGNDTGLTHLAAAAGGRTVMILGPSDPERYGPFAEDALAVWKPAALRPGGVAAGGAVEWDWARDGISVDDALDAILPFLRR